VNLDEVACSDSKIARKSIATSLIYTQAAVDLEGESGQGKLINYIIDIINPHNKSTIFEIYIYVCVCARARARVCVCRAYIFLNITFIAFFSCEAATTRKARLEKHNGNVLVRLSRKRIYVVSATCAFLACLHATYFPQERS